MRAPFQISPNIILENNTYANSFSVSNEIRPIIVTRVLGSNLWVINFFGIPPKITDEKEKENNNTGIYKAFCITHKRKNANFPPMNKRKLT